MSSEHTVTYSSGDSPDRTEAYSAAAESETVEAPLLSGGQVFANRFEVVKQLGEGGMGQVFRVHDRQIEGREVALKILHPRFSRDPRFRGLFFQEVRAGQSFVSEHVVQVRDTGQMEDGRLFLTMDLVEGENLSGLLKREHSLDSRHALEIARQALLGLKSGHDKGFIHRDIKPSNLMLRARTPKTEKNSFGVHVLILDFGLANLAKELKTGQVAGTPFYMSPEQVRDERLDARSDLFAVAVCLYEMISGSRPFQGKTMAEITSSVIETDVGPMIASLEHLSPAIQKILERALQKDREQRFQSAGEFIEAIERSKAYRLPTRVAPWLMAVTVTGTIAAGAEGLLLLQREGAINSLNGEIIQQRSVISTQQQQIDARDQERARLESQHTATLAEKDAQIEEKQRELDGAQGDGARISADKDAQIAELTKQNGELNAQVESLRKKDETSDTQTQDLQSQIDRLEAARKESERRAAESERRVSDLGNDFRSQEKELARLREENEKLRLKTEPEAQRAAGFDVLVRLVSEDRGVPAWQKYLDLEKETLGKGDPHGGDFVEALARAARELEHFDEPPRGEAAGEARHLVEAAQALADADKALGDLERLGADWLTHTLTGGAPPDRMGSARAALEHVKGRLAEKRSTVSGAHEAAANELAKLAPLVAPTKIVEHVGRYGCEHGIECVARAAEAWTAELVGADGRLDEGKLRRAEVLDAWGTELEARRLPADSEAAATLLALWVARGWYAQGEVRGNGALHTRLFGAETSLSSDGERWRAILGLQLELERTLRRTSGDLPTHGIPGLALYRQSDVGGTASWFKETARNENGGWTIERELLYTDPTKPTVRTKASVSRQGNRYQYGWVLDLAATGASLDARAWPLPQDAVPSEFSLIVDAKALAAFHSTLPAEGLACLVIEENGIEHWIAPRYGLVREAKAGTFQKDLVYTNTKRNTSP
jgi:serine/threonine protein kinase